MRYNVVPTSFIGCLFMVIHYIWLLSHFLAIVEDAMFYLYPTLNSNH